MTVTPSMPTHPTGVAATRQPVDAAALARSLAAHPASVVRHHPVPTPTPTPTDEEGSLVTEYGLLAVVAATIAGVVISWSSGGALVTLFNALLRQARALVGA